MGKQKNKSKLRVIDSTDDDNVGETFKGTQHITYSSSEDAVILHDPSLTRIEDLDKISDKGDLKLETEMKKFERCKDSRRRKHDSGKSEKSDSETHSKSNKSNVKSGHVIQKSKSKSDIPDIASMVHSDITTDEEVVTGKITSRRNSSKESRDGKSRVHGNSQRKNLSKSILDTESDSAGSNSGSC